MQSRAVELLVGFFVCLGIAAIFILTMRVSNLADTSGISGYTVAADFNDIGGLKVGSPVNMAGVRIGRVTDITLDQQTFQAVAKLSISDQYKIPKDSDASILTSGLLGEQYVGIGPGGSMDNMKDGDKFIITQSAVVLENLIGQFMTTMGSDSGGGGGSGGQNNGGQAPAGNNF
ncbi:outer membrane lipid asymmetry maintenance protein MlaD [Salinisphaera sp. T31B1]|uniref:outer membrane lipid asymmetry maintenance protein MlaD n=1 Tax=Salinisphaera sp. T31B1 TaxID=727963 RepID=UPI00334233B9